MTGWHSRLLWRRFHGIVAVCATTTLVAVPLITLGAVAVALTRSADSIQHRSGGGAQRLADAAHTAVDVPQGDPIRVRIPAIGVVEPLVPLGLNADGTLEVPGHADAGWFARGTRPGQVGPAVIVAHLDSVAGPGAFFRLRELKAGDVVHVDYGDASVTFTVQESARFAKTDFPTKRVYGPTKSPELRLITCDGKFDRQTRSHTSNLVVWASVTSSG